MNGDILSLIDFSELYNYALQNDTLLTIAIKKEITPFAFGNIFFKGDFVTGIEEKPDIIMYILAGIYVMKPEILNFIPVDSRFGVDELIKKLLASEKKIAKYDLKEYWLDIGRINDYEKAQVDFKTNFKE
jgi:NDP-sugar pyrophosphorylase family protein